MRTMTLSTNMTVWNMALVLGFILTSAAYADSGTIETVEAFESKYVGSRRVDVWLPDGYSAAGPALPVIYAQDGQNLFRSGSAAFGGTEWEFDETIAKLVAENKIRPAIVVGIWNTQKRFVEYAPEIPVRSLPEPVRLETIESVTKHYGEGTGGEPIGDNYLRFMVQELKPFIDENYNTLPGQADTFAIGSSMGGLISIYALARYPDVFGGAMCLSTHWPLSIETNSDVPADAIIGYLDETLPQAGQHRIYFDFGTETLDAWYEPHQAKMDKVMVSHGYVQGEDWVTMKFQGEPHNEIAWKKRLHIPVEMMLGTD